MATPPTGRRATDIGRDDTYSAAYRAGWTAGYAAGRQVTGALQHVSGCTGDHAADVPCLVPPPPHRQPHLARGVDDLEYTNGD